VTNNPPGSTTPAPSGRSATATGTSPSTGAGC
jgi:hypothetical protein